MTAISPETADAAVILDHVEASLKNDLVPVEIFNDEAVSLSVSLG